MTTITSVPDRDTPGEQNCASSSTIRSDGKWLAFCALISPLACADCNFIPVIGNPVGRSMTCSSFFSGFGYAALHHGRVDSPQFLFRIRRRLLSGKHLYSTLRLSEYASLRIDSNGCRNRRLRACAGAILLSVLSHRNLLRSASASPYCKRLPIYP
jgi:hypothetical protein